MNRGGYLMFKRKVKTQMAVRAARRRVKLAMLLGAGFGAFVTACAVILGRIF